MKTIKDLLKKFFKEVDSVLLSFNLQPNLLKKLSALREFTEILSQNGTKEQGSEYIHHYLKTQNQLPTNSSLYPSSPLSKLKKLKEQTNSENSPKNKPANSNIVVIDFRSKKNSSKMSILGSSTNKQSIILSSQGKKLNLG